MVKWMNMLLLHLLFYLPFAGCRAGLDARINLAYPGRQAPAPILIPCSMQRSAFLHSSKQNAAIVTAETSSHEQGSSSPLGSPPPFSQQGCSAPPQPIASLSTPARPSFIMLLRLPQHPPTTSNFIMLIHQTLFAAHGTYTQSKLGCAITLDFLFCSTSNHNVCFKYRLPGEELQ
ncbi:hypothetical protein EV1_040031 [Malus domestica]